jgi:hypothetical protein
MSGLDGPNQSNDTNNSEIPIFDDEAFAPETGLQRKRVIRPSFLGIKMSEPQQNIVRPSFSVRITYTGVIGEVVRPNLTPIIEYVLYPIQTLLFEQGDTH